MCFGMFVYNRSLFKITKQKKKIKEGKLNVDYFFIILYQDPQGYNKLLSVPSTERNKGKGFNFNVSIKSGTIQKKFLTHCSYYRQVVRKWFGNFLKFPSK